MGYVSVRPRCTAALLLLSLLAQLAAARHYSDILKSTNLALGLPAGSAAQSRLSKQEVATKAFKVQYGKGRLNYTEVIREFDAIRKGLAGPKDTFQPPSIEVVFPFGTNSGRLRSGAACELLIFIVNPDVPVTVMIDWGDGSPLLEFPLKGYEFAYLGGLRHSFFSIPDPINNDHTYLITLSLRDADGVVYPASTAIPITVPQYLPPVPTLVGVDPESSPKILLGGGPFTAVPYLINLDNPSAALYPIVFIDTNAFLLEEPYLLNTAIISFDRFGQVTRDGVATFNSAIVSPPQAVAATYVMDFAIQYGFADLSETSLLIVAGPTGHLLQVVVPGEFPIAPGLLQFADEFGSNYFVSDDKYVWNNCVAVCYAVEPQGTYHPARVFSTNETDALLEANAVNTATRHLLQDTPARLTTVWLGGYYYARTWYWWDADPAKEVIVGFENFPKRSGLKSTRPPQPPTGPQCMALDVADKNPGFWRHADCDRVRPCLCKQEA